MNFDFRNLKIKNQAYIVFGVLALMAVINFLFINSFRLDFQRDSEKIDLAGKTRMLSQRIALLANQIDNGEGHLRSDLQELVDEQDNIFRTFQFGGKLLGYDAVIDPLEDAAKMNLLKAQETWGRYRLNLEIFLTGSVQPDTTVSSAPSGDMLIASSREEAFNLINRLHDVMLNDCKSLVETLVASSDSKKRRIKNAFIIFLVANILIFSILFYLVVKYFFNPLNSISITASRISSGDLDAQSDYAYKNELGGISNTLNEFVTNLKNATSFVQKIGEGDLDETLAGVDENNVSKGSLKGALLTMRDKLKQVQQKETERKWSTEGLTEFVDILRSNQSDVHELGNKIISKLVDYTKSNQGGIYLLNDDEKNKHLELIALYAFNTRKYDQQTIRLGEGLVGQTFLEKKTTYLLEIPHDYITIVSGLGGANPKAILVVPLIVNEEIYGIIELASFNEYQTFEIEFVEKLGESIASTISSVKTNQQTKKLLEESQLLTEKMQAQEEEMRQNMEELTATQEEMARTEKELYAQQSAINTNIGVAEFSVDGKLLNTNVSYASNLGYSVDELKDTPFINITTDPSLWESLKNGSDKKGWFRKTKRSGEQVEMQSSFSVITAQDETRIIELITEFDRPEVRKDDQELSDVEAMLRQQMEELNITQEQLDQKIQFAEDRLNAVDAVFNYISCDQHGSIININDKALTSLDMKKYPLTGSDIRDIFKEADLSAGKKILVSKTGQEIEASIQIANQNKETNIIFIIWT